VQPKLPERSPYDQGVGRGLYPGGEARVIFPIEPEAFFVDGVVPTSEVVSLETPEEIAG
jgi:hypothetical protein